MELCDLYCADRSLSGQIIPRDSVVPENRYRLIVHLCIFNSRGEMLIQQRQSTKSAWPDLWDFSVGGNATHGEDSATAIERETEEELGLSLNFHGIRPYFTINFETGFDDFYLIIKDLAPETLRLQPEEVQAIKWATREEILQLWEQGKFMHYYPSLIHFLFDTRGVYGSHQRD